MSFWRICTFTCLFPFSEEKAQPQSTSSVQPRKRLGPRRVSVTSRQVHPRPHEEEQDTAETFHPVSKPSFQHRQNLLTNSTTCSVHVVYCFNAFHWLFSLLQVHEATLLLPGQPSRLHVQHWKCGDGC